jgi:prepilin peptidase CpaA
MDAITGLTIVLGCSAVLDDLRRGAISNWINLTAIASGLLYHSIHQGWLGLAMASAGAALGFAIFLGLYCMGGMGGGDVKLMAAFGALLGPLGILTAAVLASVIGGLMAAASLVFRRRRKAIPYGPAIVLGAWLTLLAGR